jgi:hypothetical protein
MLSMATLAIALLVSGVAGTAAQDATPMASPVASPGATPVAAANVVPAGTQAMEASYADWATRWWQWALSFPTAVNPGADTSGGACGLGQNGPVFFLATSTFATTGLTRNCTIPEGVAVLVPVIAADCSTAEATPYHGTDAASLSDCVKALVDPITDANLTIDGMSVTDLASFRVQTPVFSVILPEGNFLNAPAGPASVLGDGVFVLIEPMSAGTHTVAFGGTYPTGSSLAVHYNLTVAAAPVPAS